MGLMRLVPLSQTRLSEPQYQLTKGKQKLRHICMSAKSSVEYLNLQAKFQVDNS